jgi:hypothetical protein
MTKKSICLLFAVFALAIMLSACETPPEPMKAEGCVDSPSLTDRERMAQGAHNDSVQECIARIPCESTANQRMLAEESCKAQFAQEGRKDFDKLKKTDRDQGGRLAD